MKQEEMEQINKTIGDSIEKNVNGKIRSLDAKIDEYIKRDNEWKESVTPSIDIMKKMQGYASVSGWMFKGIVLIGATIGALMVIGKLVKSLFK